MVKKLLCIENVFLSFSSQQIILVSGEHREISYAKGKITTRGISMGVHDKKKKKRGVGKRRSPGRKRKMSEILRGGSMSPPLNTCTILFYKIMEFFIHFIFFIYPFE